MRLVEATEHGQEEVPTRESSLPLDVRVLVKPAETLLHRRCPVVLGLDNLALAPVDHDVIVRPTGMFGGAFAHEATAAYERPSLFLREEQARRDATLSPHSSPAFSNTGSASSASSQTSRRVLLRRIEHDLVAAVFQAQAELPEPVAGLRRRAQRLQLDPIAPLPGPSRGEACPAELDLEPSIAQLIGQQLGCSLEQAGPGTRVLSEDRSRARPAPAARRRA